MPAFGDLMDFSGLRPVREAERGKAPDAGPPGPRPCSPAGPRFTSRDTLTARHLTHWPRRTLSSRCTAKRFNDVAHAG